MTTLSLAHRRFVAKTTGILCAVVLVSQTVQAQYLGDVIAAAGYAGSEEQFVSEVTARGGSLQGAIEMAGEGPPPGTPSQPLVATRPVEAQVYDPMTAEEVAEAQRRKIEELRASGKEATTSAGQAAPAAPAAPIGPIEPLPTLSGTATGYAGASLKTASQDPRQVAAWHQAWLPAGRSVTGLPAGAETVKAGGKTYSYHMGVFYQKSGSGYVVVPAPVGAQVTTKPLPATTVFADGKPLSYYYGAFYIYRSDVRTYEVVKPPAGVKVSYLPEEAKKVQWSGSLHYQYGSLVYRPVYEGDSLVFLTAG